MCNGVIITVRFSEQQNTCHWLKATQEHHNGGGFLAAIQGHLDMCPISGYYEHAYTYFWVEVHIHFSWE